MELRYKVTGIVGKKKQFLGNFKLISSVDKIIAESKKLNTKYPTTDKKKISINVMRGNKITARRTVNL